MLLSLLATLDLDRLLPVPLRRLGRLFSLLLRGELSVALRRLLCDLLSVVRSFDAWRLLSRLARRFRHGHLRALRPWLAATSARGREEEDRDYDE